MKKSEYEEYIESYFNKKNISVGKTGMNKFLSKSYLNYDSLKDMKGSEVKKNIRVILDEVSNNFNKRRKESKGNVRVVTNIDVNPVLKQYLCSCPPIC